MHFSKTEYTAGNYIDPEARKCSALQDDKAIRVSCLAEAGESSLHYTIGVRILRLRRAIFVFFYLGSVTAHQAQQGQPRISRAEFTRKLVAAAIERTHHLVRYVSEYVRIPYPGGDVPADTGVCTDEIIRSYRAVGVDLQKEVHEDMGQNFAAYPNRWHRTRPDSNIDHRRVPNLMVFFQRKGESLPITSSANDYAPGDLVTWDLGGGVPHIGIVVDQKERGSGRYMIVHNIGEGPKMEDVLFHWKITGHYRYFGP